jgi:hypothetical protein
MYPVIIRKLFDDGCMEYNDCDRNIVKISNQPFRAVRIPDNDIPKKRYADVDTVRKIFGVSPESPGETLAHDVSMPVLYLMGINIADLYSIEKTAFRNGKLCYNRLKTEKSGKTGHTSKSTQTDQYFRCLRNMQAEGGCSTFQTGIQILMHSRWR